jgi:beta-galactosidase
MEQQSGAHGWTNRMEAPAPKPGQMRLWTMQSVAHGADMVNFFRWRTSPMGNEIYWHGLNDHSNTPNRRLVELAQIASEWRHLEPVHGAVYQARIAVLKDYDNAFDASIDIWHGRVDRFSDDSWFRATQQTHTPCDFLYIDASSLEDLSRYDLLVYPHPSIMTPDISHRLRAYVEGGGTLVWGARTGYKDRTGQCPIRPMPGLVSQWCGVTVADYTLVRSDQPVGLEWGGRVMPAPVFNEMLVPETGTEVLARFTEDYYAGQPALTRRSVGAGTVYYLGACFSEPVVRTLLTTLGLGSPYADVVEAPESMELTVRSSDSGTWLFLLNYLAAPGQIRVLRDVEDALTGDPVPAGAVSVPAFGVSIFRI